MAADLLVFSFAAEWIRSAKLAGVAQLVEQLICNHQVGGSNPFTGSNFFNNLRKFESALLLQVIYFLK